MAILIPSRASCLRRMTSGEKRFSERLEEKLDTDYLCWFDVPIGPKQLRPDFVIVHPHHGLWVLEVKDWNIGTIQGADRQRFRILGDTGLKTVANPLEQARIYSLEIDVLLRRDPALRNPPTHEHAGRLVMPWAHGVVLSNITRSQFKAAQLDEVIPGNRVICKDEMTEGEEAESFQSRLWSMLPYRFRCELSLPQLNRIRAHLYPYVRVSTGNNQFGLFAPEAADGSSAQQADADTSGTQRAAPVLPDLIKVMDITQEQLARSLGDGHRVIHGVAGSGKTMILGFRCVQLAREVQKPILVLCFNITLAARLRQMMERHGIADRVTVLHFHDWCGQMLAAYNMEKPKPGVGAEVYLNELVDRTVRAVDLGHIPRAQYSAVMIDEGHDFKPEWLKLIAQMVDPVSNSLLLLYDDAQAIYGKGVRPKFSFASVGIQARGRTTILKLNYRNTQEILFVARAFASQLLDGQDSDEDGAPIIAPESAGRTGDLPCLLSAADPTAEARLIADRIADEQNRGRVLSDIAVVYRKENHVTELRQELRRRGIAYSIADSPENKKTLFSGGPAVKLVTMHSSKGLEFHTVIIPRVCQLPDSRSTEESEARLLYVGMTRATDNLIMTHNGQSAFIGRLQRAIGEGRTLQAA
jgi:hypothetical protein